MNFNKEDVYKKMFYELYKAKDSYGVDVLTEIYNYLTKVIEKKLKKTNIMTNQDAKWYTNCNLAIYKECFGITPLGKFSDMETANRQRIPIPKPIPEYYYGYIFIMPKKDGSPVPYSGDYKNYDKFMLTVRNGDFVLEKFNNVNIDSDDMAKNDQNEKINLLKKENKELMEKKTKLESDVAEEIELKLQKKTLKQKTKELNEKTNELNEKTNELNADKIKKLEEEIKKLEEEIKKLKTNIEYKSTVKETAKAIDESSEIADLNKLIKENQEKIEANAEPSPEGNTGGFLIKEEKIGGEIYLTFSVSEYLEKNQDIKSYNKNEDRKKITESPTVIKIVQDPPMLGDDQDLKLIKDK